MSLNSNLFKTSQRLNDCAVHDAAHVKTGDVGDYVRLIQIALMQIDELQIEKVETDAMRYGPSTARAVLSYKTKRSIINRAYQQTPDAIVGKMTIASLDDEMRRMQYTPKLRQGKYCTYPGSADRSIR
jgi:hypothetical protein